MKNLITVGSLLILSQVAVAEQTCINRTKIYVTKTMIQKYISAKITSEVSDWRECYAKARQEAQDYKAKETMRVEVKIFNRTVSDSNKNIYLLTDWKVSDHWYSSKIKGTVNAQSLEEPLTGFQAQGLTNGMVNEAP